MGGIYRNTREYDLAYNLIIGAAARRQIIRYTELAPLVGLKRSGNHMGNEIGRLLREICENEHRAGRPLLSSIVVNSSGKPGPGYFEYARSLGKLPADGDEKEFWESEKEAVHTCWSASLNLG